ncbi:putative bifunctional diguanylate cyclase/phosphodiesterase [Sphingomonas sp. PAMC 26621]|uniref:putative bifunctional diguanylate cyclase/phosphodiesterase n=1 Tax=Sphingomonas sp. PAMC 26621 TaxID=1112213 RepID=UPI0011114FC3|nr:EAL domain-containing protein [Sphingomonas sp. PAMC 26621]
MLHDPLARWTGGEAVFTQPSTITSDLDQLLGSTMRATACSGAAVLVLKDGKYELRATAGSLVFEDLAVVKSAETSALPSGTFQILPPPRGVARLRVDFTDKAHSGFAVASAFDRASGVRGLLLVIDELARGQLSPAQTYVLDAQAAHCGTLIELEETLSQENNSPRGHGEQSQRLRLLESVAVHARDSIIITEAEPVNLPGPRILFCNAAFERATGYSADEVLGRTPRILQGPATDPVTRAKLRDALAKWEPVEVELVNYRKDGTPFWVELSIVPVANQAGWFTHWVSVQRDITERKAAEELAMRMRITQIENEMLASEISERKRVEAELVYTAYHDNLTRLRNRAFFMERLAEAIERNGDVPARPCAVLFLDLDRFKVVNDSLGHLAGDTLLKEIARRLKGCIRPQDTLARIGGDEFAVLVDEASDLTIAVRTAECILATMRAPVRLGRQDVFPACSIGIVRSSVHYSSPEALLRDADIAMYEAKRAGHGDYAVFDESMHATAVAKLQLQTDLRRAVERSEFELAYQPIVTLCDEAVAGFEALLRWRHPAHGLLSPVEFIDAAEEIGLIRQIDRWVRVEACTQLKRWQVACGRPDLRMSVNVSATEFADANFVGELAVLLMELDLSPSSVQIEITEGVFLHPTPNVIDAIDDVRRLGVRIALDDFGTGYSSLSYLNRYPIDTIKIDKSFVAGMSGNQRTLAVVELIVQLGRKLDVAIVAEGVEEPAEAMMLKSMGCTLGQGYYFSWPVPAIVAATLL